MVHEPDVDSNQDDNEEPARNYISRNTRRGQRQRQMQQQQEQLFRSSCPEWIITTNDDHLSYVATRKSKSTSNLRTEARKEVDREQYQKYQREQALRAALLGEENPSRKQADEQDSHLALSSSSSRHYGLTTHDKTVNNNKKPRSTSFQAFQAETIYRRKMEQERKQQEWLLRREMEYQARCQQDMALRRQVLLKQQQRQQKHRQRQHQEEEETKSMDGPTLEQSHQPDNTTTRTRRLVFGGRSLGRTNMVKFRTHNTCGSSGEEEKEEQRQDASSSSCSDGKSNLTSSIRSSLSSSSSLLLLESIPERVGHDEEEDRGSSVDCQDAS